MEPLLLLLLLLLLSGIYIWASLHILTPFVGYADAGIYVCRGLTAVLPRCPLTLA
jgi:hypothetical protein